MRFNKVLIKTLRVTLALAVLLVVPAWAEQKVTFMLDWYPNPDHVPVYAAKEIGAFAKQGLKVEIMVPADPNDPMKLVAAGKIDFAISYEPSVLIARSEGLPIVSTGALIQHPLSTILFLKSSGIKKPADLRGRTIGYSVEPLYRVLLEAVAEKGGLKPGDYKAVRVGFNLVPPLLSGKVDAVIGAFRNYEAIQVELEGKQVGILPLEENGVPDFYELVIIASEKTVKERPALVLAFMRALSQGIDYMFGHTQEAFGMFVKAHPDLSDELNRRAFTATLPYFKGSPLQDAARWSAMQSFMKARGLIKKESPVQAILWQGLRK
jgi:putative hydroxymethylpyrimidine transport system substrate-binding protein